MLSSTKEKFLLSTFAVLLSAATVLYFLNILWEAYIVFMLSLFALFLYSQTGDKSVKFKKYAFRFSIFLGLLASIISLVFVGFMYLAFSQLGNTDVRWQNHYFLPQFSYGYLSYKDTDTHYPLYSIVDSKLELLDAKAQDCLESCQSGRMPFLSTRSADCTKADLKDANDPNCASKDFQIIKRYDGKKQWAYLGKLLYYYPNKERNGSWWQPNIDDISSKHETNWRPVQSLYFFNDKLVNSAGRTVYQSLSDQDCVSKDCTGVTPLMIENEYQTNIRNTSIFNEKSFSEDRRQWTFYNRDLFTANADQHVGDSKGLDHPSIKLDIVKFQPGFMSKPSEKYLTGGEKQLQANKNYFFNFRGQFLAIPKKGKNTAELCDKTCQQYFVPYLVEQDSTQNTSFGSFAAKSIGNDQYQWFYRNAPVFIVVNSYGWPMLDQLDPHQMQLISP